MRIRPIALLWCIVVIIGPSRAEEGRYLLHAAGCVACHTAKDGVALAGGRALETPYGVFYSPNITPDDETGIGRWTGPDFVRALRHGRAPDGSAYYPAFPYTSYRGMTEQDALAIFAHLQTLPPQRHRNREHELKWWIGRWMMRPWQWLMLDAPNPVTADTLTPDDQLLARGRYLVDALGHCGECHSPRNRFGATLSSSYLAGSGGPKDTRAPNITPDPKQGIGRWRIDDLSYFLESGGLPNGDYTGGSMVDVIDHGTAHLSSADRDAIAAYLKSIPALPGP